MALNVERARFGEQPSDSAVTLYVIWESDGVEFPAVIPPIGEYDGWWLAAVNVGANGSISLVQEPRMLDFIPNQFTTPSFATVAARTDVNGDQIVEIAWAEAQTAIPTCPSTASTRVVWYHAVSTNGGAFSCLNEPCSGSLARRRRQNRGGPRYAVSVLRRRQQPRQHAGRPERGASHTAARLQRSR